MEREGKEKAKIMGCSGLVGQDSPYKGGGAYLCCYCPCLLLEQLFKKLVFWLLTALLSVHLMLALACRLGVTGQVQPFIARVMVHCLV